MRPLLFLILMLSNWSISLAGEDHDHAPKSPAGAPAAAAKGHSHDHDDHHAGPGSVKVEFTLAITDKEGQPLTGANESVTAEIFKGEEEESHAHSHAEEEPGVYHMDLSLAGEGSYRAVMGADAKGQRLKADFPLVIGHSEPASAEDGSVFLWVVGAVAAILIAFWLGRSTGKGQRAAMGTAVAALFLFPLIPVAQAGDDHGHSHDEPASSKVEPLQVGIGALGQLKQTKVVNGWSMTLTVAVIPPDPNVVALSEDQRELLGLEVETITATQGTQGIAAVGQVRADSKGMAVISAQTEGRIESLSAALGQRVTRGQVLAVIQAPAAAEASSDVAVARAALIQAMSNAQRAEAGVKAARQNLARQEGFAAAGAFSQPSLAAARTEMAASTRELASAKSQLREAMEEQTAHQKELERLEALFADKLASRRDVEVARLETRLDAERVSQAQSRVAQAEAALESARGALAREDRLEKEGLYNRREIEAAKSDLTQAEADLAAAQAEVRAARELIAASQQKIGALAGRGGRITLTSPIAGTVTRINANVGEAALPGQALIEVLDTSTVWIEASLFEADIRRVKLGMPVNVWPQSDPGKTQRGVVGHIDKAFDEATRTAAVRIRVSNPDGALRQNEFAGAFIVTDQRGARVSVAEAAVQEIGGLKVVFVEGPDGFRRTPVKLGSKANKRWEALSGLKVGDKVATQGSYQLRMMAVAQ
jgi:RND family efflux transporter MFP subunit